MRLSNALVASSVLVGLALLGRNVFSKQRIEAATSIEDNYYISELAYQIWESEGRPEGESERHWEMAVKLFKNL